MSVQMKVAFELLLNTEDERGCLVDVENWHLCFAHAVSASLGGYRPETYIIPQDEPFHCRVCRDGPIPSNTERLERRIAR